MPAGPPPTTQAQVRTDAVDEFDPTRLNRGLSINGCMQTIATLSPRSYDNGMNKINTRNLKEESWSSPKGKFVGFGKEVSEALGRQPASTDLMERHPFDVEIVRIPAGKAAYPYHSHSAQWEFYHIISGSGQVRHKDGTDAIAPGDAFIFKPGEPHQLIAGAVEDLIVYVVADNPIGESYYYPDSRKWGVRLPERRILRSEALDYYDGEE
jgi:uncharacterized cupin superfamily protein